MKKIKKEIVEALNFYNEENEENEDKLSPTKLAEQFNIDKATLLSYIRSENNFENLIKYNNIYYYLDEEEYKAVNEFINTDISFLGIRNKYGYKQETFKKKLEVLGYSTEKKYKLTYNRDKLKEIKTEEDAYILGFILADGYINEKSNMLRIKLQEKDLDILKKFCDYFEMDYSFIKYEFHNITGNKQYYLSIYDKNIIESLKLYGLTQNKSCKEVPYYNIDKSLIRHYIRGIWDGDGYIGKSLSRIGVCGSKDVLDFINKSIIDDLELNFSILFKGVRKDNSYNIYRLDYAGKKIDTILDYLYKESTIYLNRKYALYEQIRDINKNSRE